MSLVSLLIACLVCALFAIVGGISKFQKGHSRYHQRVVSMLWLVTGQLFGLILATSQIDFARRNNADVAEALSGTLSSFRDKEVASPDLLERLGLDPEARLPYLARLFKPAGKVYWYYTFWSLMASSSFFNRLKPDVSIFVILIFAIAIYGATSIAGFVIVGQMLVEYGNCIRVY